MEIYHNSQDIEYRKPFGAVKAGERVLLAADVNDSKFCGCSLRLWTDSEGEKIVPMSGRKSGNLCRYSAEITAPEQAGLVWYCFIVDRRDGGCCWYGNNSENLGGVGEIYDTQPPSFQITVYDYAPVPDWYKNAIVYQIFPDRFNRSPDWLELQQRAMAKNSMAPSKRVIQTQWSDKPYYTKNSKGEVTHWPFFGGTLSGIREKILYLKSIGVTAVYLNPIFEAHSNHRYDTADYMHIDPALGTDDDFKALAEACRDAGIRIILDGVFSHTGVDSRYFDLYGTYGGKGAASGKQSEYYDWYNFKHFPDDYDCWWGVKDLPNVNEMTPSYQSFIYGDKDSVIRHWLKMGADGWRLDVADELPDEFISGIRRAIKEEKTDGLLIGEVWEDASNKISYGIHRRYLLGNELDGTMHYPFRDGITDFILGNIDSKKFSRLMMSIKENYPPENYYGALSLLGSHDKVRILTLLGQPPEGMSDIQKEEYSLPPQQRELGRKRLKMAAAVQFTSPGVPCIYYGDEAGLEGFEDPYNRATFPWGNEDGELMFIYRMLADVRHKYPVFTSGDFETLELPEDVYGFVRFSEDEYAAVIINRSTCSCYDIQVPAEENGYCLELLNSKEYRIENKTAKLKIEPLDCAILYFKKTAPQKIKLKRSAGVICPVASLPSGSFSDGKEIIDFLCRAGQHLWQILPLNPVGKGGSPYWSPAVFAGEPSLIDRSKTCGMDGFREFCDKNSYWLEDWALYAAIKEKNNGLPWQKWPDNEKYRKNISELKEKHRAEMQAVMEEQYVFHCQWKELKAYAADRGISIVGDIPVYVAPDSADTWSRPELFMLDAEGYPSLGAGVPPDYFSPEGQNWGNPLYNWQKMREDGYDWWTKRIGQAMELYDYIRLDHFRSFSAYYAIPRALSAKNGFWLEGAGLDFFSALEKKLGRLPVIAEDLGHLDSGVYNLLKLTGFPGMNVWQFSADEMSNMSEKEAENRIFYTGTHDNQTLVGWCRSRGCELPEKRAGEIIESIYKSGAPWAMMQIQDVLLLGDEARINVPGTCGENWVWRLDRDSLSEQRAEALYALGKKYGRV